MFYVNNKQVLGMFLNGNNYNYMSFGFGKIIPENRSAQFAYINLAGRNLSQYRVTYGNIQSGYDNFPVARLDYPVNGVFHSPLTYFYGGNIVPTKNVPVYINNGYCALENALVYNDISINGNIVYFADNSDFQGHNVNIHPENFRSSSPYFNGTVMDNCSNFTLHSGSHLSKSSQATLYDCKKFIGWFNYFGDNDGTRFPGFRGFLHTCRDGVFSFNLMNMRGGGSDGSVTNYYNFSCISNCNNIKLNINGSPWQAWVHPDCYSSNCNINTRYIVPGFDRMRDCNFKFYIPSHADVEKSAYYSILSNSYNCNVYFDGTNSNLYSFRNEVYDLYLFESLNNCNLNLIMNNSACMGFSVGNSLNNCNIVLNSVNFAPYAYRYFSSINNCNVTGDIIEAENSNIDLITYSTNVNLNVNASLTNVFGLIYGSSYINGNVILGNRTFIRHSNNLILNLYNGNTLEVQNVSDSKLTLNNVNNVNIDGAYNTNFNLYNAVGYSKLYHLDNVTFIGRFDKTTVTNLDNCFKSHIYVNTIKGLIENVYNTYVSLDEVTEYNTVNVYNCDMTGFPGSASYHTEDCTFRVPLEWAQARFRSYFTWANVWPHATPRGSDGWDTWYSTNAGLESTANLTRCYLNDNNASQVNSSSVSFDNNKNMIMSLLTFYSGTVKVNLPNYATNIKLNVDCHNLNLGVFMAGPPHELEYSSISADNIFCTTGNNYFVQMNYGTRLYCENYCNVAFSPVRRRFSDNYQPVLLINNYQHSNAGACRFYGGITRIGRLNYQSYSSAPLELYNGACMFINNTVLGASKVDNALLFLGTNVRITGGITVTNSGLVVNKANYSMDAIGKFVNRKNFVWNFTDSGPWGRRSLLDFCTNV